MFIFADIYKIIITVDPICTIYSNKAIEENKPANLNTEINICQINGVSMEGPQTWK